MQLRSAARVILVGAPGVGKGTQTERMLRRFPQLSSISSGDLLRENVRNKTALGIQAQAIMASGALLPDKTILRLIVSELTNKGWLRPRVARAPFALNMSSSTRTSTEETATAAAALKDNLPFVQTPVYEYSEHADASFLLDGFPRTATQARSLGKLLPINMVVHIQTPTDVILSRICNRWIHAPSGRVYNATFNAPRVEGRDDVTGEALVQRDDDKPETWRARLAKFEESSLPLLEHYHRLGVLWTVRGESSDEITPKLFAEFAKRFGRSDMT